MLFRRSFIVVVVFSMLAALPSYAKEGVVAILRSAIGADVTGGNAILIRWSLLDESTGEPFSACQVFVRLTGNRGTATEAFSACDADTARGNYAATVTVPDGGIADIQIGVAGTVTDGNGNVTRSDWLIALKSDPTVE